MVSSLQVKPHDLISDAELESIAETQNCCFRWCVISRQLRLKLRTVVFLEPRKQFGKKEKREFPSQT